MSTLRNMLWATYGEMEFGENHFRNGMEGWDG